MGYRNLKFDPKTVFLVTGGAGFIGSNLCEAILEMGYKARCMDNLSSGKLENINRLMDHPGFDFINGDIRDMDICKKACERVHYVLHQAALGSVPRSMKYPVLYEQINIMGTLNMLEAARQNNVLKFVYASSSSVYGDETALPQKEGREGTPLSPYALTKQVDEKYARLYTALYGLDTYGLRYFNVFGKNQDPKGPYAAVIPKFITQILNDKRPTIYGDGYQSRDFTYIENVIEANLKACGASHEAAGEVYNIACGGREYLINVFKEISKALGKEIEAVFEPERRGDIKHSNADITKARKILGYEAEWDFRQGIIAAIKWYKENL